MATNRINRINEEVFRALTEIIRDLKDPRIPMMTSVVNVSVTNDLRYAKAYISIMGTDEEKKAAIKGLSAAAGFAGAVLAGSALGASALGAGFTA